ncbi:MAG: hypothetical protein ACREDA_00950 [Methylocella sp.]
MRLRKAAGLFGLFGFLLSLHPFAACAESLPPRNWLQQELKGKVPSNWEVHVSRRGDMLLAFITPPYQDAFDLWYEPAKLRERMLALCPGTDDTIWQQLAPQQTIAIEPTVGGKSADAMRLTCYRDNRPLP